MNTAEINAAWRCNIDVEAQTEADLRDDFFRLDNERFLGANPLVWP